MSLKKRRKITAEDLYRFLLISSARISPGGEHAIYAIQRVDPKKEKKYSNLWRVDLNKQQPRQFTYGDQSDNFPCWSPDGSQIAFLSNRKDPEKPAQIYLIPSDGGEEARDHSVEGRRVGLDRRSELQPLSQRHDRDAVLRDRAGDEEDVARPRPFRWFMEDYGYRETIGKRW